MASRCSGAAAAAAVAALAVCSAATVAAADPKTGEAFAVVYAGGAVLDEKARLLFVADGGEIAVRDLATNAVKAHLVLAKGSGGELWPTATGALWFRGTAPLALEARLVGATALGPACAATVTGATGSHIMRIDSFTDPGDGTTYLKWETAPASPMRGGKRLTNDEIAAEKARFDAAYTCGVLAVRARPHGGCALEPASDAAAHLDSCATRAMPPHRVVGETLGNLALSIDLKSTGDARARTETSELVVSVGGKEHHRVVVGRMTQYAPPP